MASRILDLPEPFRPVMELKDSSLCAVSILRACRKSAVAASPSCDDRPHGVRFEALRAKLMGAVQWILFDLRTHIDNHFRDPHFEVVVSVADPVVVVLPTCDGVVGDATRRGCRRVFAEVIY